MHLIDSREISREKNLPKERKPSLFKKFDKITLSRYNHLDEFLDLQNPMNSSVPIRINRIKIKEIRDENYRLHHPEDLTDLPRSTLKWKSAIQARLAGFFFCVDKEHCHFEWDSRYENWREIFGKIIMKISPIVEMTFFIDWIREQVKNDRNKSRFFRRLHSRRRVSEWRK